MTALDQYIKDLLKTQEVDYFPFSLMENGKIEVPETRNNEIGAIVKSIDKYKIVGYDTADVTSVFYFFCEITNEGDTNGEINPKIEKVLKKCLKFINAMRVSPFSTNPSGEQPELLAEEMITTAVEVGLSFSLTFRISIPQCSN